MDSNFYELLRVSPEAPTEVIHAAYLVLMSALKKHPELGESSQDASLLGEAYSTLSHPEKRAVYDKTLIQSGKKAERNSQEERRIAARKEIAAGISYCVAQDHRWYAGRVCNISSTGIKFQTAEPVGKGQRIVIVCSNPASQSIPGTVCWAQMYNSSLFRRVYEVGVAFAEEISDIERRFF